VDHQTSQADLPLSRIPPSQWKEDAVWLALIALGVLLRVTIVALPGNQLRAPWSGGGDAPRYVLLAQNLVSGKGFTYALQPTALRAPGYPVLLAGVMLLFDGKYVLAIRWIQFAMGLGTVYFCSRASARLFGERAGRVSLIIGLFFPTLVFVTG
jgi:4-amino-4-deoxy-L-arabinose transferase-like glycosyltransferase